MRTSMIILLLMCCNIVPCFSANVALTAQVNIVGNAK